MAKGTTASSRPKFNTVYFSDNERESKSLFSRTKMRFLAATIAQDVNAEVKKRVEETT